MKGDARARRYWNRISKDYDDFYVDRFSQQEDAQSKRWLAEAVHSRAKLRVLDVGCGTGLGLALLPIETAQIEYTGMDISEGMISQFQAKVDLMHRDMKVTLRVGDARQLDRVFPANSFDLIIIINAAASYVGTPTQLLKNSRVVLSENGALFASFLHRFSLRRLLAGKAKPVERYNTRGADEVLQGVRALTVSQNELKKRCMRLGLQLDWIRYQSVLGGVWENDIAASIERVAIRVAPGLGHTINLLAHKPADMERAR
jgi:ubiquinone/menaquinone biosynthesis C-methylase UbiE